MRTPVGGGALLRQNFILVSDRSGNMAEALASAALGNGAAEEGDHQSSSTTTQPAKTARRTASKKSGATSSTAAAAASANSSYPAPGAVGSFEFTATETLEPVAPGAVVILSPAANSVVMAPAMELMARVALNWTVKLEVNGRGSFGAKYRYSARRQ